LIYTNILSARSDTSTIYETRNHFEKWIQLKVLASEEAESWKREKASLEDMIEVAKAEEEALIEKIESLKTDIRSGDTRRAELRQSIDEAKSRAETFKAGLMRQEKTLTAMTPYLPPPLKKELQPLIQRLPKDPEKSDMALAQRMQTAVGIITQIEKFQGGLSLVSEIKDLPGGESIEVKTLYIGLAQAFFADAGGRYSGTGQPAEGEWTWNVIDDRSTADNIRKAISMYENTMEPAFVQLPITVTNLN
jgi:hypothetical protein